MASIRTLPLSPALSPEYRGEGSRRSYFWGVALIAIAQFCLFLNHRDITTAHEVRVAATAREMLASGEWIIPHANGKPRLEKPPLAYWAAAGVWKLTGRTDVWLARLPAALCGAIATLLVMNLARQTLGRCAGIVAGLVWVSTFFIVDEYRKAMADPYLAFFTLLSAWSWITARTRRTPGQSVAPPRTVLLLLLSYTSLALGALSKGPLILLHVALALLSYHLIKRQSLSRPRIHAAGIVIMLAISLPWPVQVTRRLPGAVSVWREQIRADRATSGEESSPPWHYAAALPLTSAPWTVLAAVGAVMPLVGRRRRDRRAVWPLVWLAGTIVVFTVIPMKKNTYILPAMPAQTLLIAALVASIVRSRRHNFGDRLLFAGHAIAAGAAFCVILFLVLKRPEFEMEPPGPLLAAGGVGIFLVICIKSLSSRLIGLRTFALTALGFALVVHGIESWLAPDFDNRRSDAPFPLSVRMSTSGQPLYFIGAGLREDVLFYLGGTVPVLDAPAKLPDPYSGYAIVAAEHMARLMPRGDKVRESAGRPHKDKLYLMKFPKDPTPPLPSR